jgi:hypothetical protein
MTAVDQPVRHRFTSGRGRVRRRLLGAGLTLAAGAGLAIGVGDTGASANSLSSYTRFTDTIGVAYVCKAPQNSPYGPYWTVKAYGFLTREGVTSGFMAVIVFRGDTSSGVASGVASLNNRQLSATVTVNASRTLPDHVAVLLETNGNRNGTLRGPAVASLANC